MRRVWKVFMVNEVLSKGCFSKCDMCFEMKKGRLDDDEGC